MRILTYKQLRERGVFYSRRHLRNLVVAGTFPQPIVLSETRCSTSPTGKRPSRIVWLADEINQWLADKAAQRAVPREVPVRRAGAPAPDDY